MTNEVTPFLGDLEALKFKNVGIRNILAGLVGMRSFLRARNFSAG